jgi:hypothetical protein
MRLRALRPWYNPDEEGQVEPGQFFDATEYRAGELIRAGLAEVALEDDAKIKVVADPPPPPPPPTPSPARRSRR